MKLISKSGCCLVVENVAFFNPHLRKIIFKIYNQKTYENQGNKKKNEEIWYLGHTDSENFQIF